MSKCVKKISLIFMRLEAKGITHDFNFFEDFKTFKNKSENRCETPPPHSNARKKR